MRFYRVLFLLLLSLPTFAHEGSVEAVRLHPEISNKPGWNFNFKLGVDNPNFNFNRSVPGVDNGTIVHLGGNATLNLNYLEGQHEWRNKLSVAMGYDLNQFISEFVKARDDLVFETTYYFSLTCWMGLFGQGRMDTSIMPGLDIQPPQAPTRYDVFDINGVLTSSTTGSRLTLTGVFQPMTLTENVGIFARPVTWSYFSWEATLGAIAIQGLLNGQLKIADVNYTPDPTITTVNTLENFYEVGAYVGNRLWGVLSDQFTYTASLELGYMFFDSALVNLPSTFADNATLNASVGLSYQPLPWLGFSWEGNARYQPYVTTDFQLDSLFNLNFLYSM